MEFLNRKPHLKSSIIMLIGLIIGLWLYAIDVVGFDFSFYPGDLADGRLNLFFLEHAYQFFTFKINNFWDAAFMYPEANVIAFSDNLLGTAPIYSFFRLLGFDMFTSYQLWFVILSTLNYIAAFYFLKYIFKNNYVATLGAFVFAFSMALMSQISHAQTFPRFPIPLALLMAVKFSEELKPKYFFLTIFFVVYQIYCGIYLGFMLAVPIGIYLLIIFINNIFILKKVTIKSKWFLKIILSGILNFAALLILMLHYMKRGGLPSMEHYREIFVGIAKIESHFYSVEGSMFWDFLSGEKNNIHAWWDHQIFAGGVATISLIICFAILIITLIKSKFKINSLSTPLMLILIGLFTFLFFIRFDNISAYIVIYLIPGLNSMRAIARIINIELIFFAIATAFIFYTILKKQPKYQAINFLAAMSIIVCDNYTFGNYTNKTSVYVAKERVKKLDNTFAKIPKSSVFSYEPITESSRAIYCQIDAMLIAQKYCLKTLNAYTATSPIDYGEYWYNPNEKSRIIWLSHKKLDFDTLYVVKAPNVIEKIAVKDMDLGREIEPKVKEMMVIIKNDSVWMKSIEAKAIERNISTDSMLFLDAEWTIKNS